MITATASVSNCSSYAQAVLLSIPGAKPLRRPLPLPPLRLELEGTRPPQKRWLPKPNLLRLRLLRMMITITCAFACRGKDCDNRYRAHRDGVSPCFPERDKDQGTWHERVVGGG